MREGGGGRERDRQKADRQTDIEMTKEVWMVKRATMPISSEANLAKENLEMPGTNNICTQAVRFNVSSNPVLNTS
jgi:hypothetical protein